jgi:uroporphyrin-III C-methyltransferase
MTVSLVGAGPGDPGLLTVRGREALERADVVLHDGLVDERLLALAPPGARIVDVGKSSPGAGPHGGRYADQDAINALLVAYGRAGARVVRLKGGDPFVFGRGGEEALALAEAGVEFEVVPGVSSAVAVPAYAGIPITHRGLASAATIVTGHEAPGKGGEGGGAATVDWAHLAAGGGTLVVLMGVARLPQLAADLIAHGRAPDTPAAVIQEGTTRRQRVVSGPLVELPRLAAAAHVRSPAVIVVGEVIRLREQIAWFGAADRAGSAGRASEAAPVEARPAAAAAAAVRRHLLSGRGAQAAHSAQGEAAVQEVSACG